MTKTTSSFGVWLLGELGKRGWNQSELARRAEVSNAAISDVISGRRNLGKDLATAIAKGLKVSPEFVFQKAGFLPLDKEHTDEVEQIIHEAESMTRDEQLELLSYIRWRNNQRKKK